jgi:hypothetical protein
MNEPLVNIIIITTNQFRFIGKCIYSLLDSNYKNIKIFSIDNNSNRKEYQEFYNKHKHIKQISFFRLKKNVGFAGACNYGIKKIKKGYIVFLNDDVIVSKDWLIPIISYMEKNSEVGACQPKIKNMVKRSFFDYAGAAGGMMDVYGYPYCRGRIFYTVERDAGQYDDMIDLVWCSGACMVTKKEVITKVGLLDEIFFIYQEEADFCWRMHFFNYRLVYIPTSTIFHYGSATMKNGTFKKTLLHHRNTLILLIKNYTARELWRYLPIRIVFDFISFWYYFIGQGNFTNACAVVCAYANLMYLMPSIIKRRKKAAFKMRNKNKKPYPLYKNSIIVNYFLLNRKSVKNLCG